MNISQIIETLKYLLRKMIIFHQNEKELKDKNSFLFFKQNVFNHKKQIFHKNSVKKI